MNWEAGLLKVKRSFWMLLAQVNYTIRVKTFCLVNDFILTTLTFLWYIYVKWLFQINNNKWWEFIIIKIIDQSFLINLLQLTYILASILFILVLSSVVWINIVLSFKLPLIIYLNKRKPLFSLSLFCEWVFAKLASFSIC